MAVLPGTASAAPVSPSDGQLGAAQQTADAAADQVRQLLERQGAAQAAIADADARAAAARAEVAASQQA